VTGVGDGDRAASRRRTLFLAEAVQAGFSLGAQPCRAASSTPLLGVGCPTILFPYLRETISDLIARGPASPPC